MPKLFRLLRLEPIDRYIILQVIVALPLVASGLRIFGFNRLLATLSKLVEQQPIPLSEVESVYVARVQHWVRYAKRQAPYPGNCLSRSLIVWWLLRRRQIDCSLRIGTRKHNGVFQAHAWVEYRGQPLNAGARVKQKYATFDYDFLPETVQAQ